MHPQAISPLATTADSNLLFPFRSPERDVHVHQGLRHRRGTTHERMLHADHRRLRRGTVCL